MTCVCATISPPPVAAIDRAQAAYNRIAASAEVILPFVSPERAARIRLAMALTERGLLPAHYAATAAEQLAALKQAEAATAAIVAAAKPDALAEAGLADCDGLNARLGGGGYRAVVSRCASSSMHSATARSNFTPSTLSN
jgi:hypothetical protein